MPRFRMGMVHFLEASLSARQTDSNTASSLRNEILFFCGRRCGVLPNFRIQVFGQVSSVNDLPDFPWKVKKTPSVHPNSAANFWWRKSTCYSISIQDFPMRPGLLAWWNSINILHAATKLLFCLFIPRTGRCFGFGILSIFGSQIWGTQNGLFE